MSPVNSGNTVASRLIRRLRAGNPDRRENLQCICGTDRGYKLQADHELWAMLGHLQVLREHHFGNNNSDSLRVFHCLLTKFTPCTIDCQPIQFLGAAVCLRRRLRCRLLAVRSSLSAPSIYGM